MVKSPHIETETAICKISSMMLWDHGHHYIQSTPVLCDIFIVVVRRPRAPVWSPYGGFPCILRLQSTTCYSELIEESVCLFAMDSTRREAALARRRERERARRANETAEERETRLARRRVRDRRANETAEERETRLARRQVRDRNFYSR